MLDPFVPLTLIQNKNLIQLVTVMIMIAIMKNCFAKCMALESALTLWIN